MPLINYLDQRTRHVIDVTCEAGYSTSTHPSLFSSINLSISFACNLRPFPLDLNSPEAPLPVVYGLCQFAFATPLRERSLTTVKAEYIISRSPLANLSFLTPPIPFPEHLPSDCYFDTCIAGGRGLL